MTKYRRNSGSQNLRTCVYNSESQSRTAVSPSPVGLNKRHEDHLVSYLQEHYGWHLGDDGNLYSPHLLHSVERRECA